MLAGTLARKTQNLMRPSPVVIVVVVVVVVVIIAVLQQRTILKNEISRCTASDSLSFHRVLLLPWDGTKKRDARAADRLQGKKGETTSRTRSARLVKSTGRSAVRKTGGNSGFTLRGTESNIFRLDCLVARR